jgi:hypothetical protein
MGEEAGAPMGEVLGRGGRGARRWWGGARRRRHGSQRERCYAEDAGVLVGGGVAQGVGGSGARLWGGTGWRRQWREVRWHEVGPAEWGRSGGRDGHAWGRSVGCTGRACTSGLVSYFL